MWCCPSRRRRSIAALGIIYGTLLGALLGSFGLITGGLFGYALMLTSARRHLRRLVGPQSLRKLEHVFDRGGAWAIVLSRSLPYSVPEAMVFLAGLAGMPIGLRASPGAPVWRKNF